MKTVTSPTQPRAMPQGDGSTHPFRPVSALEAELDASGETIVIRLRDPDNSKDFAFALLPPAAKQLAELLEQAVEDYLHSAPPLGTE